MIFDSFKYLLWRKSGKTEILFHTFLVLIGFAAFLTLVINSPNDYQQLETVKIMYVHVPCSWLAIVMYFFIFLFSLFAFIWKNAMFHIYSIASAKVGVCFALLSLITGSIWGKVIWGTWWVWDARLTSMLMLFLMYIAFIVTYDKTNYMESERLYKILFIISCIGLVDLPIIKWSVEYFNTLHQPSSFFRGRGNGIAIHKDFLEPLIFGLIYFTYLGYFMVKLKVIRMRKG